MRPNNIIAAVFVFCATITGYGAGILYPASASYGWLALLGGAICTTLMTCAAMLLSVRRVRGKVTPLLDATSCARLSDGPIVRRRVISEPVAAIKVTELDLSDDAKASLRTDLTALPRVK